MLAVIVILTFYDGYQVTPLQKMRAGNVFMVGRWVEEVGREREGGREAEICGLV